MTPDGPPDWIDADRERMINTLRRDITDLEAVRTAPGGAEARHGRCGGEVSAAASRPARATQRRDPFPVRDQSVTTGRQIPW